MALFLRTCRPAAALSKFVALSVKPSVLPSSQLNCIIPLASSKGLLIRSFVTDDFLRMAGHRAQVAHHTSIYGSTKESFLDRLKQYVDSGSSAIYADDVLAAIRISQSKEDLDVAIQAASSYLKNTTIQPFTLGPVLMRQIYLLDNLELAEKIYNDLELRESFLGTLTAKALYSQILFKHGCYDKVLESNLGQPDLVVSCLFAFAAALKLNTAESYQEALGLFKTMNNPPGEAVRIMAMVAYQQNDPKAVFEILNKGQTRSWFCKQLRMMCYIKHDRAAEAALVFQSMTRVIDGDSPPLRKLWFKEVVDALSEAVAQGPDETLRERFAMERVKVTDDMFREVSMEEAVLDISSLLSQLTKANSPQRRAGRPFGGTGQPSERWEAQA